jgi:hypothetical protein
LPTLISQLRAGNSGFAPNVEIREGLRRAGARYLEQALSDEALTPTATDRQLEVGHDLVDSRRPDLRALKGEAS